MLKSWSHSPTSRLLKASTEAQAPHYLKHMPPVHIIPNPTSGAVLKGIEAGAQLLPKKQETEEVAGAFQFHQSFIPSEWCQR